MESIIYNGIGIIGDILILSAFFAIQAGKIKAENLLYPIMNLFGASGILISLFYAWNLSAFIIESIWVLISLFGIIKFVKAKHNK